MTNDARYERSKSAVFEAVSSALVTQASISSRQVDRLHQRLIGAWSPPS